MDLHIYTRELLDKHLLPELKEIAQELGITPDGNKTRRETWVAALVGQPFPIFQAQELIEVEAQEPIETPPGVEIIQALEPIEKSLDADRASEQIEPSELDAVLAEIARLRAENQELMEQVRSYKQTIYEAKDITPVQKCSFIRVFRLARAACLDLCKSVTGGWVLSLGSRSRTFKTLYEIWRLLVPGDWFLSDLLDPPEKVPTPSPDAFSHNRAIDWFATLGKVGLQQKPLEAVQSRRSAGRFAAIPFCDDGLIDSYLLGFAGAESSARSPPSGGDAM